MKTKFLLIFLFILGNITLGHARVNGSPIFKNHLNNFKEAIKSAPVKKVGYSSTSGKTCLLPNKLSLAAPLLWSNPATWTSFGSTKPVAGSDVTIPDGVEIILDESPPSLSSITVMGKLVFADQNINLTAKWIMVHGTFQVGTSSIPYTKKAVITLNDTNINASIMGMGTRGIMVMGGTLELHGITPLKAVTKINDHAARNAKSVNLVDAVTWKANDEIVIATSDFYMEPNNNQPAGSPANLGISAQKTTLTTAANGTTLNFANGLDSQRWGKLQYVTATGMSLSPGTLPAGFVAGTPTVVDERAEVANLTRNIVIQSPNDAVWQNNGFGCHIMIMKSAATAQGTQGVARLNGVEIKRGGQAGKLGRYPFHWHLLSYQGTATLADVTNQYIRNSVINESANRGIVIHGTNGTEVTNNIVYDVRGHGIFTEDASERRNTIVGNVVMKVRNPLPGDVLKIHESDQRFGSSGFWISNPDNIVNNNTASDCVGFGFWLAFPAKTFGESKNITPALKPSIMHFGEFKSNVAHSNQITGIHIDDVEIDELGNTSESGYASVIGGGEPDSDSYSNVETYELTNYAVWKNNGSGIWNRTWRVANRGAVNSSNTNKFYSGSTRIGSYIEKSLAVGQSLNYNMNQVTAPEQTKPPVAFATYNTSIYLRNNTIVNFPIVPGVTSGAFALDDFYAWPVNNGLYRNTNNVIVNSHPGVRVPTPETTFAFGLIEDPENIWGGAPGVKNYYSYDRPFFTYGQTPIIVAPGTAASGGVVVSGPFYGVTQFWINQQPSVYMQLRARRYNNSFGLVDTYVIDRAIDGHPLQNMRHFAMHYSGIYDLDFQENDMAVENSPQLVDISVISDMTIQVSDMLTTNDYVVMAMEYSGAHTIDYLYSSIAGNMMEMGNNADNPQPTVSNSETKIYLPVASRNAVIAAPLGEVYWQDKANNKVWFKIRGGLRPAYANEEWNSDNNLHRQFKIRAYGRPNATLGVNSVTGNGFESLYPNPTTNAINIEYTAKSSSNNLMISVKDASGREVLKLKSSSKIGNNKERIDLESLTSGVYFVTISDGKEINFTKRVIKK